MHLPVRRAAVELRGNRPANAVMLLEEARAFERRYTEVLYLRGLAYLTMRESAAVRHVGPMFVACSSVPRDPGFQLTMFGSTKPSFPVLISGK